MRWAPNIAASSAAAFPLFSWFNFCFDWICFSFPTSAASLITTCLLFFISLFSARNCAFIAASLATSSLAFFNPSLCINPIAFAAASLEILVNIFLRLTSLTSSANIGLCVLFNARMASLLFIDCFAALAASKATPANVCLTHPFCFTCLTRSRRTCCLIGANFFFSAFSNSFSCCIFFTISTTLSAVDFTLALMFLSCCFFCSLDATSAHASSAARRPILLVLSRSKAFFAARVAFFCADSCTFLFLLLGFSEGLATA
mmetsp:Transcript_18585/g.22836  ORF Transcript_18585/g.22836 Transcript_18585/m.22836 type:complete len:259 (-) Transcript_18585:575-1351(-)